MVSLLEEFKGAIRLIYIDPPFDVGADFTLQAPMGDENDTVAKEQSLLEFVAYRDTWGRGTESYLAMMYERLMLVRELLTEDGSDLTGLFCTSGSERGSYEGGSWTCRSGSTKQGRL